MYRWLSHFLYTMYVRLYDPGPRLTPVLAQLYAQSFGSSTTPRRASVQKFNVGFCQCWSFACLFLPQARSPFFCRRRFAFLGSPVILLVPGLIFRVSLSSPFVVSRQLFSLVTFYDTRTRVYPMIGLGPGFFFCFSFLPVERRTCSPHPAPSPSSISQAVLASPPLYDLRVIRVLGGPQVGPLPIRVNKVSLIVLYRRLTPVLSQLRH